MGDWEFESAVSVWSSVFLHCIGGGLARKESADERFGLNRAVALIVTMCIVWAFVPADLDRELPHPHPHPHPSTQIAHRADEKVSVPASDGGAAPV